MILRTTLLLALMSAPLSLMAQSLGANLEVPPGPGLEEYLGSCASLPGQDPCLYAVKVWAKKSDRSPVYLVAGKSLNNGNRPDFLETDRVPLPASKPGYSISPLCSTKGQHFNNTTLVGNVRFAEDQEVSKDVTHAWRLDIQTGKWSVVDPRSVSCQNELP